MHSKASISIPEQDVRHFSIRLKRPLEIATPNVRHPVSKLLIDASHLDGMSFEIKEGVTVDVTEYTPTEYAVKNRLFEEGDVRWSFEFLDVGYNIEFFAYRQSPFPSDSYDKIRVLRKGTKVRLVNVPQPPRVSTESYGEWLAGIGIGQFVNEKVLDSAFAEARKPKFHAYTVMAEITPGLWVVNMDAMFSIRREMFLTEELHVIQAWEE